MNTEDQESQLGAQSSLVPTDSITNESRLLFKFRMWLKELPWIGVYFLIALILVALIRSFLVQSYMVPSGSMENTLQIKDLVMVWKPKETERGDIVVFRDDLDWLGPAGDAPSWKKLLAFVHLYPPVTDQYLVKRVIGLPGDSIECCDSMGRIILNSVPLDEPYLLYANSESALRSFQVIVPEGRIFVMGDHRDNSKDSRAWLCSSGLPSIAMPSLNSVQGSVFAIIRPVSRMQLFSTPEPFQDIPKPSNPPPSDDTVEWHCR